MYMGDSGLTVNIGGKIEDINGTVRNRMGYNPDGTIGEKAFEVKEEFDLKENAEQTKELIAVHNMTAGELEKSLDLGGLPMPSIAIIKARQGHSDYGDVSIVFNKETIDPQFSKWNKVYSGDAWTPTFPKIEYKANKNVSSAIVKKYYELYNKFGREATDPLYGYGNYPEDQLNRDGGEKAVIKKYSEDTDMMNLFLYDTAGKGVEPVIKEIRSEMSDEQKEVSKKLLEKLGSKITKDLVTPKGKSPVTHRVDWYNKNESALNDALIIAYEKAYDLSEADAKDSVELMNKAQKLVEVRNALNYSKNEGVSVKTETDIEATKEAIRNATDKKAYMKWLHNLFDGIEEKSGIYNGRDPYTSMGNRRSFEYLHYEVNLENIIKEMRSHDNGETLFGGTSIWGSAAKKFKSIAEIKKDSGRLKKIPEEEYDALRQEYTERLSKIANSIVKDDGKNKNSWDYFELIDDAAGVIAEAVRDNTTTSGVIRTLNKYSSWLTNINEETAGEILKLADDIANMPTGYFEAKPERAVGFDEAAAVIVPDDTDRELLSKLADIGVPVYEYPAGDESARLETLNKVDAVFEESSYEAREKDASKVTKEEVEDLLDRLPDFAQNSYIPVKAYTPDNILEIASAIYGEEIGSYPLVMRVEKAVQVKEPDGNERGMNVRGHEMSTPEMLEVLEKIDGAKTFYWQNDYNNLAVIVGGKFEKGNKVLVSFDFNRNINRSLLNGYNGGIHNVTITMFVFDPENWNKYQNNKNHILIKKEDLQRGSSRDWLSHLNRSSKGKVSRFPDSVNTENDNSSVREDVNYFIDTNDAAPDQELIDTKRQLNDALRELKKQTERAEYLKGQTRLTKQRSVTDRAVRDITKKYADQVDTARLSKEEIAADITELANKTLNVPEEYTISSFREDARKIAVKIADNEKPFESEVSVYYRELLQESLPRGVIEVNKMHKPADFFKGKGAPGNILKRARIQIRFVDTSAAGGSSGIDSTWKELSSEYPSIYSPDVISEGDMLDRLVETVIEATEPKLTYNPYIRTQEDWDEYIDWFTEEILSDVLTMEETAPTFADKKKAEKAEAVRNAKEQVRQKERAKRDEAMRRLSEKARISKETALIKFSKKVNGTFYVVEAVPDSSYKKIWVLSAYMQKQDPRKRPTPGDQSGLTSHSADPARESITENSSNSNLKTALSSMPGADKIDKASVKAFEDAYDGSIDADTYAQGMTWGYIAGYYGMPEETALSKNEAFASLPASLQAQAHYAGHNYANNIPEGIERRLDELKDAQARARDAKTIDSYEEQIEALENRLEELGGSVREGYSGYSMSNNAVNAYESGEKPTETAVEKYNSLTYDGLSEKKAVKIVSVPSYDKAASTRAEVIANGLKNAASVGRKISDTQAAVYVDDIKAEVKVSASALKHGLDRRLSANSGVTEKIGEILQASIRINESNPDNKNVQNTYMLVGVSRDNGRPGIVISTVNKNTNDIEEVYALHSTNKKESAAYSPSVAVNPIRDTDSEASIDSLLELVNTISPDILPEDVLKRFGYTERPAGKYGERMLFEKNALERIVAGHQLTLDEYAKSIDSPKAKAERKQIAQALSELGTAASKIGKSDNVKTVALGIVDDFVEKGAVDYESVRLDTKNPEIAASQVAAYGMLLRDPRFETFRILFTKGDRIISVQSFTSRLVDRAYITKKMLDEIIAKRNGLKADGYYIMHNHPSGDPSASNGDINTTRRFSKMIPGFKGHIIIDHNKYSYLNASGYTQGGIQTLAIGLNDSGELELYVANAFGKDNPQQLIDNSRILYIDENKTRTASWTQRFRVQFPASYGRGSFVTIDLKTGKVNIIRR